MSTSFVEYRGYGFWSFDDYLEHVLALVADRIGKFPDQPWLAEMRDHWRAQSSGSFRGWMDPNLDEYVIDAERRDEVLTLLDGIASVPDFPREARDTAILFQKLLRGEMTTTASSPLDYMVTGSQPYKRSI